MHQSISFTLSKNNLKEYFFTIWKDSLRVSVFNFISFFLICALIVLFIFPQVGNSVLIKCMTIICILSIIATWTYIFVVSKTNFLKSPYLIEECNLEFNEEKIILTQKNLRLERQWSELKYVLFGKYGICFVEKSTASFAFIPNETFLTDTDMTNFKERISEKIKVKRR